MDIKKLVSEISKLGLKTVNFNILTQNAQVLKDDYIAEGDEGNANMIWVYMQVIEIHKNYFEAFRLLKAKKYNDGWCLLERVEIQIGWTKRHLHLIAKSYKIKFIESAVVNFQSLFPYRIFGSTEFLTEEEICNICNVKFSIRNSCGHRIGQLYMGEMASRTITKFAMLGLALVENPVNKYSVIFEESKDPIFRDKYQFGNLNYILALLKNPYEGWKLEISPTLIPHTDYPDVKPEDSCPCSSGKDFKDCCLLEEGISMFHYQFELNGKASSRIKNKNMKNKRRR